MPSKHLINRIKNELSLLEKDGHTAVSIEGLNQYLDNLLKDVSTSKEVALARYNALNKSSIEQFKEKKLNGGSFLEQPSLTLKQPSNYKPL